MKRILVMSVLTLAGFAQGGALEDKQLFDAIKARDLKAAEAAINAGANVNARQDSVHETMPIHAAVLTSFNLDLIKLLLKHGANINARSDRGLYAWEYAINGGGHTIAFYLISHGARGDTSFSHIALLEGPIDRGAIDLGLFYQNPGRFIKRLDSITAAHDTKRLDDIFAAIKKYEHSLPSNVLDSLNDHRDVTLFYNKADDRYAFRKVRSEIIEKRDITRLNRLLTVAKASQCPEAFMALQNLKVDIMKIARTLKTKEGKGVPTEIARHITQYM